MVRSILLLVLLLAPGQLPAQTRPLLDEAFTDPALPAWTRQPAEFAGITVVNKEAVLQASERWAYLLTRTDHEQVEAAVTFTIQQPAKQFRYFGETWSVWPDPTWSDQGYEAAFLLRAGKDRAYRIQLSQRYQDVALVKYPDGGYLQAVPCAVKVGQPHQVVVAVQGNEVRVRVDGQDKIHYQDDLLPLESGRFGIGASSGARVAFSRVVLKELPAPGPSKPRGQHVPAFSTRTWLGGRPWVFDGKEPILLLPYEIKHKPTYSTQNITNVKLRPGYKPQLSWNGHWDIANQGAFLEGGSKPGPVETRGGGATLTASWSGRHHQDRFATDTLMTIAYDARRAAYTYDVESSLEVRSGEPFHFRYGYDFEHHTPLDPFRWQYLVVRRQGDVLEHRPVAPFDPGPMMNVQAARGLRLWYGRHNEKMVVAPAVEYDIADSGQRQLNTAVCAAFYDTAVSFAPETAREGTRVQVKYRYTGYPADEAERLFQQSKLHDSPTLNPQQHFIFADEWPKQTFRQFVRLSEPWWPGRRPFLSGHNQRPTYELAQDTGVGSGFAMKLGPLAWGSASLPVPDPLPPGRWCLTAQCKASNVHGPGGRIEVGFTRAGTNEVLKKTIHHVGNGTFGWKPVGFVFEVPAGAAGLTLGLGNGGSGEVYFAEVEFKPLAEGAPLPAGVAASPAPESVPTVPVPRGALADYRMDEGRGQHVHDSARGPLGLLETANLSWVVEEGRPALRFADNPEGRKDYPRLGKMDLQYFRHPGYLDKQAVPAAIAGHHGGGFDLKAFTVASWIKPAEQMPRGRGDLVGLGARRFILHLQGQKAPYKLAATLNVNDSFVSTAQLEANRWYHVALTGEPSESNKWRVRLFLDGRQVLEEVSKKLDAPAVIPPSLILGAELFYLHDGYYRGLIGHTTVFGRTLGAEEVARLASSP